MDQTQKWKTYEQAETKAGNRIFSFLKNCLIVQKGMDLTA